MGGTLELEMILWLGRTFFINLKAQGIDYLAQEGTFVLEGLSFTR